MTLLFLAWVCGVIGFIVGAAVVAMFRVGNPECLACGRRNDEQRHA